MKFADAKGGIKRCDLIFVGGGETIYADGIRLDSQSPFFHVGLVHINPFKEPYLVEAVTAGVQLNPLHDVLRQRAAIHQVCHWYGLGIRTDFDRGKAMNYALDQVGKEYASVAQYESSFGILGRWLRHKLGWQAKVDKDRWFCSELVAAALQEGGFDPDSALPEDPAETTPGHISLYVGWRRLGTLEP